MCGIAGWFRRGGRPVSERVLEAQCAAIRHRGPDDRGTLSDRDFGFGMQRLSVIDVAGGHQPMTSACGRFSIVFNGEVYNFRELRRTLEGAGYRFRTRSDTEVVLEAFTHWREGAWSQLEGMFAAAVWDHHERALHLARDPLGIKPLYWTLQDDAFAFGSELKALGPVPGLRFDPCPLAIDQYLAVGAVLAPRSIYRDVFKLEPGRALLVRESGEPQIRRFWWLTVQARADLSEGEWIEECRTRLLSTVERHLVADVPLGAFLSGGVDSSAVVAAMSRLIREPVRTFTIGFAEPRFDESSVAAEVSRHLGCRHTVRRLEPAGAAAILGRLASVFDEPFADDSAIATWYVSQLAREQVTVALSGDGGDELFAGYRRHWSEAMLSKLKRIPGARLGLAAAQCLPALPLPWWQRRRARLEKVAFDSALESTTHRFLAKLCVTPDRARRQLYSRGFADQLPGGNAVERWAEELFHNGLPADPLDTLLYADTTVWLPDDMLVKVDRASMAHSLEVRVPLLSHRFVEWTATVPRRYKLHRRTGKVLLRRAIADWLPPGILERPKQGFAVPVSAWMVGNFGGHVRDVWNESGVAEAGMFKPGCLDALLEEHRRGSADYGQRLFGLMMFAYWWRQRLTTVGD